MVTLSSATELLEALLNSIKKEFTSKYGILNLILVCIAVIILMDFRDYGLERTITVLIVGLLPCTAIINRLEQS